MKITASLLREPAKPTRDVQVQACFSCGRTYSTGDGRFCHPRCRQWFDDGDPPYDHRYPDKSNPRWYSLPMGRHGFLIPCAGCGKTFDSKGLRCCSTACERRYRQQEEAAAIMAEVAMERLTKRACLHCGGDIPNWLNPGTPKKDGELSIAICRKTGPPRGREHRSWFLIAREPFSNDKPQKSARKMGLADGPPERVRSPQIAPRAGLANHVL